MALETATYISGLTSTNPTGGDARSQGDDHIRLLKAVLQSTFPNANKAFRFPVAEALAADATLDATDDNNLFVVDSTALSRTLTLPTLTSDQAGWSVQVVKAVATNSVVIVPATGTIHGAVNFTLTRRYDFVTLKWTGSSWSVAHDSLASDWPVSSLGGRRSGTAGPLEAVTLDPTTLSMSSAAVLSVRSGVPVGTVVPYAGSNEPSGWVFCYGQNLSRTNFSLLFDAIGTTYGIGNGSTTFGLPDLRGRVVAGQDDMGGTSANRLTTATVNGDVLGNTGGDEITTLTTSNLPAHTHGAGSYEGSVSGSTTSNGAHTHTVSYTSAGDTTTGGGAARLRDAGGPVDASTTSNGAHTHTVTGTATISGSSGSTGGGDAISRLQPTIILNYIIFTGVF